MIEKDPMAARASTCESQTAPPTLILAHSVAWQAALKRSFRGLATVWALDENDLVAEASQHPEATVVFELPAVRSDKFAKLQPLFWPKKPIFVVGDIEIRSAEGSLRSLGVIDVFYAPADLERLIKLIQRHNHKYQGVSERLEIEIERNLPWS